MLNVKQKAQAIGRLAVQAYRARGATSKIFDMEELCRRFAIEPRGILHVGAHHGEEAETYERSGFERVLWIEGYAPFFRVLQEALTTYPRQRAIQALVSDQEGAVVEFQVADNGVSSTISVPGDVYRENFPQVAFVKTESLQAHRLDVIFNREQIDASGYNVLVVDVEGAELKAIRSLGTAFDYFDWVAIEISLAPNYRAGPSLLDVDDFFFERGFRRAELIVDSAIGNALYQRASSTPLERWRTKTSSLWHMHVYSRFYRRFVIAGIKRFLEVT